MKAKIYCPIEFEIPDDQLHEIAMRVRRRRPHSVFRGAVCVDRIIQEAISSGIIWPPEDFVLDSDESRIYWRRKIMSYEEATELLRQAKQKKGNR